ncbi:MULTISPECIES: YibE/F family protein [unclassified Streptomyces]|uniref:YibE/F family protein n=1 Tax=unclassified Streptomyces TaxID=2593676 RepID=UPI00224D6BB4|nr:MULTISPECIES: YibE/F family protein [unclassified Streptomyces]MCX4628863.1 YibE/F family protein [Streptomyces sp. NBC_01443]WSW44873.1 YibE/F family protein [Streptomyces sp. NBC_01001]
MTSSPQPPSTPTEPTGHNDHARAAPGHDHGPSHDPSQGHSHGHSHGHGPAAPVSKHLRKVIAAVLIPFAAAVFVGMVVLWPGGAPAHERSGVGFDRQTQQGRVVALEQVDCKSVNASQVPPTTGSPSTPEGREAQAAQTGECKKATIEVTTGPDKGRTFFEIVQPGAPRQLENGQEVVVAYAPDAPRDLQYSVIDVNRKLPLAVLAAVFAVAVVVVGRMRGLFALIALTVSFGVLTLFILPAILQGSNPLLVAVVGASAIMLIALYMCHGLSARTSVAVLGTLISLLLIGLLGSVFVDWAFLSGNTDDNTGLIHGLYPDIDMSGLLLAGVIIGSLGVLDDVTVTQTSAVWELHQADPSMGSRSLYRAAIRIGRDHIASVVNTLVLAYAGAALPLLLLFSIANSSMGSVANSELVAEEIVRTLVGSIGLVASVPVTTALAALVVSADRPGSPAGAAASGPVRGGRGRRRKR